MRGGGRGRARWNRQAPPPLTVPGVLLFEFLRPSDGPSGAPPRGPAVRRRILGRRRAGPGGIGQQLPARIDSSTSARAACKQKRPTEQARAGTGRWRLGAIAVGPVCPSRAAQAFPTNKRAQCIHYIEWAWEQW